MESTLCSAKRRLSSSMMGTPAEQPIRVAPAWTMLRNVSASRIPPAAFTCTFGPTCSFMRRTSSTVAPHLEKPVEVFTKVGPIFRAILQRAIFSSFVLQTHLEDGFGGDTHLVADAHDGAHLFFDVCPVTSFYLRDVEHIAVCLLHLPASLVSNPFAAMEVCPRKAIAAPVFHGQFTSCPEQNFDCT